MQARRLKDLHRQIESLYFNSKQINKSPEDKIMSRKVEVAGIMGPIWFIGWLFTIGFLKLSFFKGLLALFVWPYYIGDFLSGKLM